MERTETFSTFSLPKWALALLPLLLLIARVAAFVLLNPLAFFSGAFPPLEELSI